MQGVDLIFKLSELERIYKELSNRKLSDVPLNAFKFVMCIATDQVISNSRYGGKLNKLNTSPLYDEGFTVEQIDLLEMVGNSFIRLCKSNLTIQHTTNELLTNGDLVVNDCFVNPNIDQIKMVINGWKI